MLRYLSAKGERIGSVTYTYNDDVIGTVPIVATESISPSILGWIIIGFNMIKDKIIFRIAVILLAVYIFIVKPLKRKRKHNNMRKE